MISDKPKCGYFGTPDSRHRYIKEMAFCILIAFRSLMTSATLISTVSNLMAGLSKIKEDEHLGPDLEFGCARFQKLFPISFWVHVAILSDVFIQVVKKNLAMKQPFSTGYGFPLYGWSCTGQGATLLTRGTRNFACCDAIWSKMKYHNPWVKKWHNSCNTNTVAWLQGSSHRAFLWRTPSFHMSWFHEHPGSLKHWTKVDKIKHMWFSIQTPAAYSCNECIGNRFQSRQNSCFG